MGFEPTVRKTVLLISNQARSTTPAPLQLVRLCCITHCNRRIHVLRPTDVISRQSNRGPANSTRAPVRLVSPLFHCSEVNLIAVLDWKYHSPNKLIALKITNSPGANLDAIGAFAKRRSRPGMVVINPQLRSTPNLSSWADCSGTSPKPMSATRSTPQGGRFYHLFILSDNSGVRPHHLLSSVRKTPSSQSGISQFGKFIDMF